MNRPTAQNSIATSATHSIGATVSEKNEIAVMIEPPVGSDPGRVSFGRYAVEDGKVVMYDEDETPVTGRCGNRYEARARRRHRAGSDRCTADKTHSPRSRSATRAALTGR